VAANLSSAAALAAALTPYSIEDYGAVAGVDTHAQALTNGLAFAQAVGAANASSDPTRRAVIVPAGRVYSFLPSTGRLDGLSDVTILLEGTLNVSTANFSTSYPNWPNPWSPLAFSNCRDLRLVSQGGKGLVNGRGNDWWWCVCAAARLVRVRGWNHHHNHHEFNPSHTPRP
jgi:hypothetical protein